MINFKVRGKNISFWISVALSVIAPVFAYFGITGADLTTWQAAGDLVIKAFNNPYVVFTMIIAFYNAVIDPTTRGIGDSEKALQYQSPAK